MAHSMLWAEYDAVNMIKMGRGMPELQG